MYTASLRISVLMLVTLITAEVLGQTTEITGAVAVDGVLRLKAVAAETTATTVATFSFIEADGTTSKTKKIASSEYDTPIPFRVQDTSASPKTKQILLLVDSIPPRLTDVTASLNTDGKATISVVFLEDDLKAGSITSAAFSLKKTGSAGWWRPCQRWTWCQMK